jgi:hypothetical protein
MPQVDPVILRLEAKLDKYKSDLNSATSLTDAKLSAIEARGVAMGQNLKKGFSLAAGAAAAFVAANALNVITDQISKGLEYASSLGEVAQQLGVTTNALQEYRYAGSQAGLEQGEVDQSLQQLTRRLGEAANGTKAQAEAFDKLGIAVKDANGNVLDAGEAIPLIAEALKDVASPAERAAILMDLFGKSGQKLEPLLAGGAAGVNNLRDAAHELGIVLSSDQIQKADDAADKLSAVKQVLEARIAGVVADNASAILKLADALAQLAESGADVIGFLAKFDAEISKPDMGLTKYVKQLEKIGFLAPGAAKAYGGSYGLDENGNPNTRQSLPGVRAPINAALDMFGQLVSGAAKPKQASAVATPNNRSNAGPGGGSGSVTGRADRSAQNEARYLNELGRLRIDRLRAESDYSGSVEAKYKAIVAALDEELASFTRQVETDDTLTDTKRARLIAEKTAAIDAERANAEQDKARDIADRAAALSEAELKAQGDILSAKADLAENSKDRLRFELELFDLQERLRIAELDRVLATEATASAIWQAAKVQKEALEQTRGLRRSGVARQNESPIAAYARSLSPDRVDDRIEGYVVDELQSVRDSIHSAVEKATGIKDPLISGLLDILIEQVILRPLAEALSKQGGGSGGGGIGGFIASVGSALFGRASGGAVNAGQFYRVNEGASPGRVEGFIPQGAGHVIPLGKMDAMVGSRGMTLQQTINIDTRGSVNPDGYAEHIISRVRRETYAIVGAGMTQVSKSVPARMDQYQRDGY